MVTAEEIKISLENRKGDVLARTRAKYLSRWCEACGVEDPEDIDYNNPFVKIEWLLCDAKWLHAIKTRKGLEEFLERLEDPEAQDIFLNYVDDEGKSYRDLEKNRFAARLRKSLGKNLRQSKRIS